MKFFSKVAAVAASGAAVVLAASGVSSATEAPGTQHRIVNKHSNLCLQPADSSGKNGVAMLQSDCSMEKNGMRPIWRFVHVKDRDFQIVNVNTDKCLEIADSRKDNGAPAQQWTCVGNTATQLWRFDFDNDSGRIVNVNSGKVLEIDNSSTKPGAHAQQWTDVMSARGQMWTAPVADTVHGR
ncbi:RICIN domain-containing protein [Streptomyces sp. UNOC14_S4]|uniref:RICIN domain-containing protein n=1 Tax=Streptomyces sp. UNOC14_S4 TaxID=2872340 RepID=UPI001E5CB08C|nr:RICIN domain-containing protein [Streptomyces sp. UNOC14_S4]MCC3766724.1 RICIN domain-containing protein [Streptomyces sp. UNOC14_S4]